MNYHNPPKVPLSNPKLERILVGGLVTGNAIFWTIEGSIRPDSFTVPIHRQMFETLSDMIQAGQATTIPLLCARLPEEAEDERGNVISVRSYLSACIEQAGELSPMDVFEEVAELAAKRRLLRIAQETLKAVEKGDRRSDEIAADLEAGAVDVVHQSNPKRPRKLATIAQNVIKNARMAKDTGEVAGFRTGLATIDDLIGQLLPGDFGCILAAQSDGKTALARQIGKAVSLHRPVLEIQLEMGAEQVVTRDVASASGISVGDIQEGRVDAFDFDKIESSAKVLAAMNYFIHDAAKITVRQIKGIAQAMKRTGGLGLIVIDQLDKIRTERNYNNKFDRGTEVTADLKALAKELGVPIILLAQRTRMAQRSEGEVPRINDAEFPSLEKDVDWFLGLWRRETWLQQFEPARSNQLKHSEWEEDVREASGKAGVVVLKRRSGKRFITRELGWNGPTTTFRDI